MTPLWPEKLRLPGGWGGGHTGEALPFSLKVQEDVRGGLSLLPSPEDNPPEWKRRGLCRCRSRSSGGNVGLRQPEHPHA